MMKIILCLLALTGVVAQWFSYPDFRYVPYENVTNIDALNVLGYTEDTWNVPGSADVEGYLYENLNRTQIKALRSLGFTSESWDCYQNHYRQMNWAGLVQRNLDTAVEVLGFNETLWNSGYDSVPYTLYWANLTSEQQTAAERLCYFEQIWDDFSLAPDTWDDYDYDYGNATDAPATDAPELGSEEADESYYYPEEEAPELGSDEPTDESPLGEQPYRPVSNKLPSSLSANTLGQDETDEENEDFLS